jgi:hypothetical protein
MTIVSGGIVVKNTEKGLSAVSVDYGVHKAESPLGCEFIKRKDGR